MISYKIDADWSKNDKSFRNQMLIDATFVISEYLQLMSIEARFDVFQAIDGPNKQSFKDLQSKLSFVSKADHFLRW